jgi:PAS domain S-box-containing protein
MMFRTIRPHARFGITPVLVVAGVLTLIATVGILAFARRSDHSREVQRDLVQLESLGNRLTAFKWQALEQRGLSLELVSGVDDTRREMNTVFRTLLMSDVDSGPLRTVEKAFLTYVRAIIEEFGFLADGNIEAAHQLDESSLQPAYQQLTRALTEANAFHEQVARRTQRLAHLGIVAVIITAVAAITLMLLRFERARSQARVQMLEIEQETVRRSEKRFRSLVHNSSDVIVIVMPDGMIHYASASAAGVLGYAAEDLVGRCVLDLIEADGRTNVEEFVRSLRNLDPIQSRTMETRFRKAHGGWSAVEIVAANRLSDPAINGIVLTFRDISWRKRAEEALALRAQELKRSNEDLQQFAYVASHDLQEPLRMITGYTSLLARRYHGKLDKDADEFISYAVDGAKRMQGLIQDLLSYSRVGTQGKAFELTDCEEVLAQTLASLQLALEESGATVTHEPLPTVVADETQLGQLFQNLIGNAIKYRNSRPPQVHVSCTRTASEWVFAVKDNGIGIDPRYAARIFVIFQRLHTREEYPGTGIGLAVCKKIVERHGGHIWMESQPGEGATFYFTLPVCEEIEPTSETDCGEGRSCTPSLLRKKV